MFMNGVSTGTTPTTTRILLNETRKGLPTPDGERREVAPGATTLKFPEQRRDLAFHRSSNTPTTVSGVARSSIDTSRVSYKTNLVAFPRGTAVRCVAAGTCASGVKETSCLRGEGQAGE